MYTRPLAELRSADEARFGGKSASLGELIAAEIPVPRGFALSTAARADRMSGPVREAIVSAYAALGDDPPAAVRSSATGEDSTAATFAGQHETYLWVRGAEAVCDAVRNCWASLDSPAAMSYRRRLGDAAAVPAMGVIVQLMVDAAVSGVMFTCNPVSGDPSTIAVNASWGLGLAVVGGEVTPDEYRVSKVTGELLSRTVSSKHMEYVPGATGTVRVDVPEERCDQPCLDDAQLEALADMGKRVERHFGSPQDIEWAIARDGRLFLLQARPVTATPAKKSAPAARSAMDLVMDTFGARPSEGS